MSRRRGGEDLSDEWEKYGGVSWEWEYESESESENENERVLMDKNVWWMCGGVWYNGTV